MIDYLAVGPVTKDLLDDGSVTVGGTVSYSGRLAHALGHETAVLTSTDPDYDLAAVLPSLHIETVPAAQSATFSNIYSENGRVQIIHAVGELLTPAHVPDAWRDARILHMGPLVNRLDPAIMDLFPNSVIGITPQGWMRRWDENGRVYAKQWELAEAWLPRGTAVVISQDDLLDDQMLDQFRQWSRLLVMTRGWDGCTIFEGDDICHVPAPKVKEIEPTGAGDIFAAAFFIHYMETADACQAGRFANEVASQSVQHIGLDNKLAGIQAHLKQLGIGLK